MNTKSPGYVETIRWTSEIWSGFSNEMLIKSLKCCGITAKDEKHSALAQILFKFQKTYS